MPARLWFTASPSHPCQDHFVACDFFYHTKQKETHDCIYSLGAAAPALEVHGWHSLSISIFISALQECRWPDTLLNRLAIDSQAADVTAQGKVGSRTN